MSQVLKDFTSTGLENLVLDHRWTGLCEEFYLVQNLRLFTVNPEVANRFLLSTCAPLLHVDFRGVRNVRPKAAWYMYVRKALEDLRLDLKHTPPSTEWDLQRCLRSYQTHRTCWSKPMQLHSMAR